jgi:short-subunit dehydrogenase
MLQRRSGQVVIMASIAGLIATQNMGYYSASKFALVGLARALMIELYGTGVRCALICPGIAPTGFQQRADPAMYARITRLVACTSQQVAEATVRAIQRRTHGEVVVPWRGGALAILANPFPSLSRLVIRLVG